MLVQNNTFLLKQNRQVIPETVDCLPVSSIQEMVALDKSLGENKTYLKLVQFLGMLGGKDSDDSTRRVLSHIMTNRLALQLNWAGGERKRSIQEFPRVIQLIVASVRHNSHLKHSTQDMVEQCIKRWLRYAMDRDGGRTKRRLLKEEEKNV